MFPTYTAHKGFPCYFARPCRVEGFSGEGVGDFSFVCLLSNASCFCWGFVFATRFDKKKKAKKGRKAVGTNESAGGGYSCHNWP